MALSFQPTAEQWAYFASHAAENNDLAMVGLVGSTDPSRAYQMYNSASSAVQASMDVMITSLSSRSDFPHTPPPAASTQAPVAPPAKTNWLMIGVGAFAVWYFFFKKKSESSEA